jgi:hypothetical protein
MKAAETRAQMIRLAESYDKLAERAAQRANGTSLLGAEPKRDANPACPQAAGIVLPTDVLNAKKPQPFRSRLGLSRDRSQAPAPGEASPYVLTVARWVCHGCDGCHPLGAKPRWFARSNFPYNRSNVGPVSDWKGLSTLVDLEEHFSRLSEFASELIRRTP